LFSHLIPLLRDSPVFAFQYRDSRAVGLALTFGSVSFVYFSARGHRQRNVQIAALFPPFNAPVGSFCLERYPFGALAPFAGGFDKSSLNLS
jgi:hypothetical protein